MSAYAAVTDNPPHYHTAPTRAERNRSAVEQFRVELSELPPRCSARELAQPISSFARAAHGEHIPPELFIVALKKAIVTLPQLDSEDIGARADLMRDSVTLAIREYYAGRQK